MTVLAALWNYGARPAARACSTMLSAQCRGDCRSAVADCGELALGQSERNALAGEAGGAGPVQGAAGALTLVADARIDNRADLLSELGLAGPEARGCSDARLMMLCFERWGSDAVGAFVGDFALALWDRRSQRLLLARDFAGQRPLFFFEANGALAVASLARGLHALEFVPRGVDEERMLEVLAGVPHRGRGTFFRGIERVEPGEALTFGRDGRSSRLFWSPPTGEVRLRSDADYAEALRDKLDQAVAARLRGVGGTLGTHLSAGLDSSAVTTSAALQWSGRLHAFTSVPSGALPALPAVRFGDEGPLAAETAAMYPNVDHHPIAMPERLPIEELGSQLELFERTDLNLPNLVWSSQINDAAAAAGVGVILTGNAGNATISYGGLDTLDDFLAEGRIATFLAECFAARHVGGARALLTAPARRFLPRPLLRALTRYRSRDRHPASVGALNPAHPGAAGIVARYERSETRAFRSAAEVRLHMLRRVDFATYNKGVLMRWNIDLRDPTADRRLVEFCLQVPLNHYFRHGTPRALIRSALRGRVPESVRCNLKRGLQAANWFSLLSEAQPVMKRLLARIGECEAARGLLDLDEMRRQLDSWPSAPERDGSMAYRYGLLRALSAGEFIRIYSASRGAATTRAAD